MNVFIFLLYLVAMTIGVRRILRLCGAGADVKSLFHLLPVGGNITN